MEKLLQERLNEVMPKLRTARDVGPDCTCPPAPGSLGVRPPPPGGKGLLAGPPCANGVPGSRNSERWSSENSEARFGHRERIKPGDLHQLL
ncbi:collagen alpha-1(XXIII) chain-like [Anguilla rostrata]|uniref:collagen alpha-1(XXIII) chain-like n=1 Tax=Anguilla rostrata TaxID=7938 RepID=UPI0030D43C8D